MSEDINVWKLFGPIIAILLLGLICIAWLDGHAKSAYLRQVKGVNIPWYQATWLNVTINDVNAELKEHHE